jgi:hypothetical protein
MNHHQELELIRISSEIIGNTDAQDKQSVYM